MDGIMFAQKKEDLAIFKREDELYTENKFDLFKAKNDEESRKVMRTGENPPYFAAFVAIKKRLDDDNNSDDTGTYTELKRLVSFFVDNYKFFDTTMEIRMLTTLHARAVDYYNLHRGYRFTVLGKSRKKSANSVIAEVQNAIMGMPKDMKLEALSQLSSFENPPKLFANEKEYKTEVGFKSKTVSELMKAYAKEQFVADLIHDGVAEEEAKQRAENNTQINEHTGYIRLYKDKRAYANFELGKDALPEGYDSVGDYLADSIYAVNGDHTRLPGVFSRFYLRDKNGNPVRKSDVEVRNYNRAILDSIKSNDTAQMIPIMDYMFKRILDYKIPDFNQIINDNNEITDVNAAKDFFTKNYKELYEVSLLATNIQNILRAKESDEDKMSSVMYAAYIERYSEEMRTVLNDKANAIIRVITGSMPFCALCGLVDINRSDIASDSTKINLADAMGMLILYKDPALNAANRSYDFDMGLNANLNDYASLSDATNLSTIENSEVLLRTAGTYATKLSIAETRRKEAFSNVAALRMTKALKDEKLERALLLILAQSGEESFNSLAAAFLNKDYARIETILRDVFEKINKCSVNVNNYASLDDADLIMHNKDISEAILLLGENSDVKRIFRGPAFITAINRAKMVNGYCELALLKLSGKTEEDGLKKDQLSAMRKIDEGMKGEHGNDGEMEVGKLSLISVKQKSPRIVFAINKQERDAIDEENARHENEEGYIPKVAVPSADNQKLPLTEHLLSYYGGDDALVKMQEKVDIINAEIQKLGKYRCIINGKYPVPVLEECKNIQKNGTFEQKLALMMSISVFTAQSIQIVTDLNDKEITDRGLKLNKELRDKYEEICDKLITEFTDYDGGADTEDEFFKKLAEFHFAYEFMAKREFAEQIEKHLDEMGKTVDNASKEDFCMAYIKVYADGYDVPVSISAKNLDVSASKYFDKINFGAGLVAATFLPVNDHIRQVNKKMEIPSITEALNIYRDVKGLGLRDDIPELKEMFKPNVDKILSELMATGLVGDDFSIGLMGDMQNAMKLTDTSAKHNDGNDNTFLKLVSLPLGRLIKESALDMNNQHTAKYNELYAKLIESLNKYEQTHNPHSTVGQQRLEFVTTLKNKLE